MPLLQKDEMGVEHLATLERLRQSQRQDYLKVMFIFCMENSVQSLAWKLNYNFAYEYFNNLLCICVGFGVWICTSNRSSHEGIT